MRSTRLLTRDAAAAPPATASAIDVRMLGPRDVPLVASAPSDLVGEAVDPGLAKAILDDPRRFVAAAIVAGRLVGVASGVRTTTDRGQATLEVLDVSVAPVHRRQGVGRRLLTTLLSHARASGCREAQLDATRDDIALRRLCAVAGGVEVPEPVVRVAFRMG